MDLNLKGKRAIVTGASKGIGLAIAQALAGEEVTVYAAARSHGVAGENIVPVAVDLTDKAGAAQLAEQAGDVDILVNNVGGVMAASMRAKGFADIDDESWIATYELNLFSTVRVTRAVLPGLLRRRGVVINISSIGARAAFQPVDYGTAKAALNNLTKALAEEYGKDGLRALTVSPGPTRTANWGDPAGYAGELAQAAGVPLEEFLAGVPEAMGISTGRLTEPEETAALVTFLASSRSGNLTGADYLADGGVIKTV
ncbi:SDR family NAD(P)-dependent oxidoreductase [Stackebrandtia nassauensis]|uniref:Short-chain dehydrogenase/reductase SDR n=1 Tax=Stackebrandtia nassauensis (strain DSM 44728 / CIP 108903 / NRRL B-16338 / NBRC 102104 / LLR-40K-21) TaxID=446470 RepID=D3Q0Y3_STANL|nr:SDR family NAD(P)-dependent oxidoreductase [Stackebrandtia nassauensis]ADD43733.1 short-chain dehydrogenase/reductase SDR [Stackebrandtia nassauensis DSM 44728]